MITDAQVRLVQESFAELAPHVEAAAADFYARLFALAPEVRPLFRGDMADQGRKLFLTLAAVVDALDRIEEIIPVVEQLAVRHVGYGVQHRHYAFVGAALIGMLEHMLGERFDEKTRAGWVGAYRLLAETMIAATRMAA